MYQFIVQNSIFFDKEIGFLVSFQERRTSKNSFSTSLDRVPAKIGAVRFFESREVGCKSRSPKTKTKTRLTTDTRGQSADSSRRSAGCCVCFLQLPVRLQCDSILGAVLVVCAAIGKGAVGVCHVWSQGVCVLPFSAAERRQQIIPTVNETAVPDTDNANGSARTPATANVFTLAEWLCCGPGKRVRHAL